MHRKVTEKMFGQKDNFFESWSIDLARFAHPANQHAKETLKTVGKTKTGGTAITMTW